MSQSVIGPEITRVIQLLSKLPGLGPRSARRAALAMIKQKQSLLVPLTEALLLIQDRLSLCQTCGNIDTSNPCGLCQNPERAGGVLVVIADVADLWALERAGVHKGRYHVLGGVLSPLDGVGPGELNLSSLVARIESEGIREIILALSSTVEGQTTGHYLADLLQDYHLTLTRLAQGVPIGGELDYLDEGTLAAAMRTRQELPS